MLKLATLALPSPFLQAPMAGFSNDAWRRILQKLGGVGLLATEMMHARGSLEMERRRKTLHGRLFGLPLRENGGEASAKFSSTPLPLSVQIWDNQPEPLAEFAQKLVREYDIQVIDLNYGCPAPDVVQKAHSGSWLLQYPEKIGELTRAVVQAVRHASAEIGLTAPIPVTAKMRLGYSESSLTYLEVAQILQEAGVSAVTVHGRTTKQMYTGKANWERIAEVKATLSIPVIGNGDIRTPKQAVEAFTRYGVDGVMIGRVALNEPWIFSQAQALLEGVEENLLVRPVATVQRDLLLEHFSKLLEQHSETEAVMLMRKFAPCYGVGLKNVRQFRIHVVQTKTSEEFYATVDEYFPQD